MGTDANVVHLTSHEIDIPRFTRRRRKIKGE
jgi:hypothetical protein